MGRLFKIVLILTVTFSLIIYFSLYFMLPGFVVKSDIQEFLGKNYDGKFEVIDIDKSYSPDFLHQATGYELQLQDEDGVRFGNIFIQKNPAQDKWILYRGSDIEREYSKVKSNQTERRY